MNPRLAGVLVMVLPLAACVPTLHPLYTDADVIFEPELVGVWAEEGESGTWRFEKAGERTYRLVMTDHNGRPGTFTARLVRVTGLMFLDLEPEEPALDANDFYKLHLVRAHSFILVEQIMPALRMAMMDPDWLKRYVRENPAAIRHEVVGDTVVLTAATPELQAFVLQHVTTTNAFGGRSEMRKDATRKPRAAPRRPAAARPPAEDRQWEVEADFGGFFSGMPVGRESAPLPASTTFTTVVGRESRRVSSWYFGDGATLLNQVIQAFQALRAPVSGQIAPMDSALRSIPARQGGAGFGVRVGRRLTRRLGGEFAVSYNPGRLAFRAETLAAIEASRASFETVWRDLFRTGPFVNPTVTSTAEIRDRRGSQVIATATATFDVWRAGRLAAYATAGGGVVSSRDGAPEVTVRGAYRFSWVLASAPPFNSTDTVTMRSRIDRSSGVGVLGGGVKYRLAPRWGVRGEIRGYFMTNTLRTTVDATPAVAPGTPSTTFASVTTPSLQFSNTTARPDSLSGPPIRDLETFRGAGTTWQVAVTAGLFWRF